MCTVRHAEIHPLVIFFSAHNTTNFELKFVTMVDLKNYLSLELFAECFGNYKYRFQIFIKKKDPRSSMSMCL